MPSRWGGVPPKKMKEGEVAYRKPLTPEQWDAIFMKLFLGEAPKKTFREQLKEQFERIGWIW